MPIAIIWSLEDRRAWIQQGKRRALTLCLQCRVKVGLDSTSTAERRTTYHVNSMSIYRWYPWRRRRRPVQEETVSRHESMTDNHLLHTNHGRSSTWAALDCLKGGIDLDGAIEVEDTRCGEMV